MKTTISILILLFILSFSIQTEAKSAYYKSSISGKFTTKSYANSHKSTTYKSYRR